MGIFTRKKDPVHKARLEYAEAVKRWDKLEKAVLDFAAESGADLRPFKPVVHQMSKQGLRIILEAPETPESKKTLLQAWKNIERRAIYPTVSDEKYAFSGPDGTKDMTHEIRIPLDRYEEAHGPYMDNNVEDKLTQRIQDAVKAERIHQRQAQRNEDVDYRTRLAEERSGPSRPGRIRG
ncbi:MAG: hypothetical protein FJX23_10895 [Alphaproteobacteria bacterium]|nr:hypothetical protein [Alphaproteobacteria bacterium]